jgi:hypothetical protein
LKLRCGILDDIARYSPISRNFNPSMVIDSIYVFFLSCIRYCSVWLLVFFIFTKSDLQNIFGLAQNRAQQSKCQIKTETQRKIKLLITGEVEEIQ